MRAAILLLSAVLCLAQGPLPSPYTGASAASGAPATNPPGGTGNYAPILNPNFNANGAASAPAVTATGTWFSGGSGTTTKPHVLIETAGATSTNWATAGTGFGVNAASGFAGMLFDFQANGVSILAQEYSGSTLFGANQTNYATAQGVLTGKSGYFLMKAENASAAARWPGIQLIASNGGDLGAIYVQYGGGFNNIASSTTGSAFHLGNSSSNTYFAVMDTLPTPALDVTGCTGATLAAESSNWTGSITGLPTGACSIVMTFNAGPSGTGTAKHAWNCAVSDQTTGNLFRQSAHSATTVTFSGTSVSGDVLAYGPCGAY